MQYSNALTLTTDLIDNPSPRCACMLVLDTSGSMAGSAIEELNAGLQQFIAELQADELATYSVEVGVITAGSSVQEALPFTTAESIGNVAPLVAGGPTPLGAGVTLALQRLEERKAQYKRSGVAYYQPWLVIISDGEPTDQWEHVAAQSRALSNNRKLVCLPLAVQGANETVLGAFSTKRCMSLGGLKFREFFSWLSASMSRVSASNSTTAGVQFPATDSWSSI